MTKLAPVGLIRSSAKASSQIGAFSRLAQQKLGATGPAGLERQNIFGTPNNIHVLCVRKVFRVEAASVASGRVAEEPVDWQELSRVLVKWLACQLRVLESESWRPAERGHCADGLPLKVESLQAGGPNGVRRPSGDLVESGNLPHLVAQKSAKPGGRAVIGCQWR